MTTTTTRAVLFDSPFLLGFEHTRALIERAAKAAAESYPPYNVEQVGGDRVRITLAVAGFAPDQLQVQVEANQLVVAGKREPDGRDGGARPICIAASRRAGSCGPSCSRTGWRWTGPCSSTGCCISTSSVQSLSSK